MADGRRPGGLTAIAVLNFVFGGFSVFLTLGYMIVSVFGSKGGVVHTHDGDYVISLPVLYLNLVLQAVSTILLIMSGVGYIQMKKFMGRWLGCTYAILSLLGTVVDIALAHGGIGIGTIILSIWPILTLILVNTTFKDDLVN